METLAATIRDCIKSDQDIYVIQPAQMFRFWPNTDDETRFKQIQTFVGALGCRVYAYHRATGAIIIKA